MGVTKKAAIVAKTAPKKRGRPLGSKGKKKTLADIKVGEAVSFKKLNELNSEGWVPAPVNWEKLCKQLQQALAKEMHLNQRYENAKLVDRLSFLFTGKI